jgi:hypothetical protein
MGKGAVRSQMDVRISFRVRERKDVELILGQGMLNAGWHAHTLNAPGKFLISAPEHDTPRRARAYLLTDDTVSATANRHAELRPQLDEVSKRAIDEQRTTPRSVTTDAPSESLTSDPDPTGPEGLLWASLTSAPHEGVPVPHLMIATGMSRPWVYQRLRELADRGDVIQVSRGRWRAP